MPYKLVVLDLHGTLLTKEFAIDPLAKEAMERASQVGVTLALATGMPLSSVEAVAQAMGLPLYAIGCNGAVVASPQGKIFHYLALAEADARKALQISLRQQVLRLLATGRQIYSDSPVHPSMAKAFWASIEVRSELDSLLGEQTNMLLFVGSVEAISLLGEELNSKLPPSVRILAPSPQSLQVLPPEATKGEAVATLAEKLGIPQEAVLAMGDSLNDLEMIEWAGLGVALANASPQLKERAKYVTRQERGQGVLEALERFVLP